MTKAERREIYQVRARSLALVVLTRRQELCLIEPARVLLGPNRTLGLTPDLQARLGRAGEPTHPDCDIYVRPLLTDSPSLSQPEVQAVLEGFGDNGQPIRPACLLLAGLSEDVVYWGWLAEPVVTDDHSDLLVHPSPTWLNLTTPALDEILQQLDTWARPAPVPAPV